MTERTANQSILRGCDTAHAVTTPIAYRAIKLRATQQPIMHADATQLA
jgi:hypothetical protein